MKPLAPIAVAEACIEAAWDTPDDDARRVLEHANHVIRRLVKRTERLARLLEVTELELEMRDPGMGL